MQHPSRITRKKIRLLQSELQMVQQYHSQITDLLEDYREEYSRDLERFVEKAKDVIGELETPLNESPDEKQFKITKDNAEFREQNEEWFNNEEPDSAKKSEAPEWARKLFKKIALMTHPDRVNDEHLRSVLQKSFMQASKALETGKFDDLVGVAIDLKIDVGLDDAALIPLLESKIQSCRESIKQIEASQEWAWGESFGLPDARQALLRGMLSSMGYTLSPDQLISLMSDCGNET